MKLTLKDGTVINNIHAIEFKPLSITFSHPIHQVSDKKARIIGTAQINQIRKIEKS